jgi:hypothetical protein
MQARVPRRALGGIVHIHRGTDRQRGGTKGTKREIARRFSVEPTVLPLLRAMYAEAKATTGSPSDMRLRDARGRCRFAPSLDRRVTAGRVLDLHQGLPIRTPTVQDSATHQARYEQKVMNERTTIRLGAIEDLADIRACVA